MNIRFHSYLGLVCFIFQFFLTTQVHSKIIYILDFDGTIVDDGRLDSVWKTPWVMRRIDRVNSSTQLRLNLVESPETIEVSAAEYVALAGQWSVGNGSVGSYKEVKLQKDPFLNRPELIIPGYYFVDENLTFRFYKKGPNDENYLELHYQQARQRIQALGVDPLSFAGPAFPVLVQALSSSSTVGDVHIFTARNQGHDAFQLFFQQLSDDGFVKFSSGENKRGLVTKPTLHQLQGLESILYGRYLTDGKKSVAENLIRQLSNSSADLTNDYSSEDPSKVSSTHTVIIAEDDPSNIQALFKLLNELSHGHTTRKLKIVLMNTAPDHVLRASSYPYNLKWVVFNQGFPRAATGLEIKNYLGEKLVPQNFKGPISTPASAAFCIEYLQGSD